LNQKDNLNYIFPDYR